MSSKYVLSEVREGQFCFKLISTCGQELLTSSLFPDKDTALRKIGATNSLLRNAKNYRLLADQDGGLYFTVVTRKGETLAYSATFLDAEGRQAAMSLAKRYNHGARLEDRTSSAVRKPERPDSSGKFAPRRPRPAQPSISPAALEALPGPADRKVALATANAASPRLQKKKTASSTFILREEGKDRYLILFQTHTGQILLTGQFRYKDIALSQISAARTLGQDEKNYAVHNAQEGGSYFAIKNPQGETVALSETYPDPESMFQGIDLVKGSIAGARLEDLTLPQNPPKTGRFSSVHSLHKQSRQVDR